MQAGLCMFCGAAECPIRPPCDHAVPLVSNPSLPLSNLTQFSIPVTLSWGGVSVVVQALIDSGAAGNFLEAGLVRRLRLPMYDLPTPLSVHGVTGERMAEGTIYNRTHSCRLQVGVAHSEEIELYVLRRAKDPLILCLPWLRRHNPRLDWRKGEIEVWSERCRRECLSLPCRATGVESPEPENLEVIFREYRSFLDVFSKERAFRLPPHRENDCAIDLLEGVQLPRRRLYPVSLQEQDSLDAYIREGMEQGIIRPSKSPITAGFFFIKKKDGDLRPVVDYRALNAVTVKRREPLPLIPPSLEQLCSATIFTKLDLRSAYNLVRIREGDKWKTLFITNRGQFEYLVMPYGLANSPSIFQSFMNYVFQDMIDKFVIVYINDILIYSPSEEVHVQQVRRVLQRLRLQKCEFHQLQVKFLRYVIQPREVAMEEQKTAAIRDWPCPRTLRELQRFLGFANFYRRFIRNFSQVATPSHPSLEVSPLAFHGPRWRSERLNG